LPSLIDKKKKDERNSIIKNTYNSSNTILKSIAKSSEASTKSSKSDVIRSILILHNASGKLNSVYVGTSGSVINSRVTQSSFEKSINSKV